MGEEDFWEVLGLNLLNLNENGNYQYKLFLLCLSFYSYLNNYRQCCFTYIKVGM